LAQIFPKWTNITPLLLIAGLIGTGSFAVGVIWYFGSPKFTDVGYRPIQPVPFSHRLHAGELGMDCRYCHASIEKSYEANIPPTQTCMNCHSMILPESEKLQPIRESFKTGKPMKWVRVHKIAEFAYFDHSVHLNAGVGCLSCHGKINEMEVVEQKKPLSMGWCLDCHRNPTQHLRDLSKVAVTDMNWTPPENQLEIASRLIQEKNLNPPEDCSACHR